MRQGLRDDEWEVIFVNDGSTDNSGAILERYVAAHPEVFSVITQENGGLSAAHNAALAVVKGEFVTFVDSDDYLVDGAYRYLIDHCLQKGSGVTEGPELANMGEGDLDVLIFQYSNVHTDGISLASVGARLNDGVIFEGDGAWGCAHTKVSTGRVWSKFYRRAFLQKWSILFERVEWEDSLFDFEVFVRHPWTKSVGCEVYCYEHGDVSSIVSTMEKKRVLMQMKDLYYIREKMHRYREGSEDKELLSVSWIVLTRIVFVIARKIMHIPLTYR